MKRASLIPVFAVFLTLAMAIPGTAATHPVVFNSIPAQLPGNVPSEAFQATQTGEFGDAIKLAPGKRVLKNVKVVMSSWACQHGNQNDGTCLTTPGSTFSMPITLNIYARGTGGAVGSLLKTRTQKFHIKFRPTSNDLKCPLDASGGTHATAWYDKKLGECDHGLAQKITFTFGGPNFTLPSRFVYGIAYNTSGYGANPYGYATTCALNLTKGCPYDSLNVGSYAGLPSRGTDLYPDGAYQDSATGGQYCDGGTGGTSAFRLDDGCWTGYNPLVRFLVKK